MPNPPEKPVLDAQEQHWEGMLESRPEMFGRDPSEPARRTAAELKSAGARRVLELGGGQGRDSLFFASEGFQVHVLDYSRAGVDAPLVLKLESMQRAGSFKARGLSAAVSRAFQLGVKAVSIPTAGNAGCAMSAYAALAWMSAHVFMPADVPAPFVNECRVLGAEVTLIDGLITDCGRAAREGVEKFGRFDVSTLKEPYRLEGKKTMGYEVAEQMGWALPDVIIYPTGGGTGPRPPAPGHGGR